MPKAGERQRYSDGCIAHNHRRKPYFQLIEAGQSIVKKSDKLSPLPAYPVVSELREAFNSFPVLASYIAVKVGVILTSLLSNMMFVGCPV